MCVIKDLKAKGIECSENDLIMEIKSQFGYSDRLTKEYLSIARWNLRNGE